METTIIYLSIGMAFWLLSPKGYLTRQAPNVDPVVSLIAKLLITVSEICLWPIYLTIYILLTVKAI